MALIDDWPEPCCDVCGSDDVEWEQCTACWGEGEFDLNEEDGVNYAPGEEYEECHECRGRGGFLVCHACARAANKHADADLGGEG